MYENARAFLQEILDADHPADAIRQLPARTDVVTEEDWLEFKLPSVDVKKHWSKSLSAMLNSGGGIVLWGVSCRKHDDPVRGIRVDAVERADGVDDPVAFAQRLKELLPQAVEPLPHDVQVKVIDGGPSGFVACLIPDGTLKPYRGNDQYYVRIGATSRPASHALLKQMFAPVLTTELRPSIHARLEDREDSTEAGVYFDVWVEDPAVRVHRVRRGAKRNEP